MAKFSIFQEPTYQFAYKPLHEVEAESVRVEGDYFIFYNASTIKGDEIQHIIRALPGMLVKKA